MASTEFATRSHKGAGLLFLLGFGLLAAGLGFAFAPQYSWQVTKIARQVNDLGFHNGALAVGGLVTLALAIVVRTSGSGSATIDPRPEIEALQSALHLHNEQLTTKLAQLRTSLMQVQDGLATVNSQQQDALQSGHARQSEGNQSQDAIFRLAASLDKLHAHLDERVHAVDLQLRSGFEALLNSSHEVRRQLDLGGFGAPARGPAGPSQHGVPAEHRAGQASAAGHPQSQVPEGGIDFFQTMQKLEDIAGGDVGQPVNPHRGHQPQAPFPSQESLESLDALLPEQYRERY